MTGSEYVPEVAHPTRALWRGGLGVRVVVVERVAAIGPQHNGTGPAEHHLRVEDPHQVDHPQVLTLVPGAVVVDGTRFGVNIIPHTFEVTTFGRAKPGMKVNLEVDLFARYVARLVKG